MAGKGGKTRTNLYVEGVDDGWLGRLDNLEKQHTFTAVADGLHQIVGC